MLNVVMLNVVMLNAIMLSVIRLSVNLPSVILPSAIMPNVILLSAIMLCLLAEGCYAACHFYRMSFCMPSDILLKVWAPEGESRFNQTRGG
jgi:hypothetical protein